MFVSRLRIRKACAAIISAVVFANPVCAEDRTSVRQESTSGIRHSLLITGSTGTWLYDEQSQLAWETPGASHDGYVLENGNVLLSVDNTAREYRKGTQEILWSYSLDPVNQELGTVVRLDNGDTMIVERGSRPRILEVSQAGLITADIPLQPDTDDIHMQTRMARKLPTGHYLVPHLLAFRVKEYTPEGKVVRSIPTDLPEFGDRE